MSTHPPRPLVRVPAATLLALGAIIAVAAPAAAAPRAGYILENPVVENPIGHASTLAHKLLAPAAASTAPWLGLIAPTSTQLNSLSGSSVAHITVGSSWDLVEPAQNSYSAAADSALKSQIASLRSRGFQVVLDLGLQYPPSWVFTLPGPTRFVDQYGDQWHGDLSTDVPNLVFNASVRAAAAGYLAHVAAVIGAGNLASIRVGGLLSGELRYPPNTYNGHADLIWDYDPTAQAGAPLKGWKPGTGTPAQAVASLGYYDNSLTAYETWLMKTVNQYFPSVNQQILFPSWGIRPGQIQTAANAGMNNTTLAEVNGTISAGLDWPSQVAAIAASGLNATVYTTWLDAPSQGSSPSQIPPVDYLTGLAAQYGLPVAGENTGKGGVTALNESLARVKADHLIGMMYMSGPFIADGSAGITLQNLMTSAALMN